MKFEWEEIYCSSENIKSAFYEATCRAKTIGGWLLKHTIHNDYQFESSEYDEDKCSRYIDDEGYQNVTSTLTFIPDPNHEWVIDE